MVILARCTAAALTVAMIVIVLMLAFFVVPRLLPFDDPGEAHGLPAHSSSVHRL